MKVCKSNHNCSFSCINDDCTLAKVIQMYPHSFSSLRIIIVCTPSQKSINIWHFPGREAVDTLTSHLQLYNYRIWLDFPPRWRRHGSVWRAGANAMAGPQSAASNPQPGSNSSPTSSTPVRLAGADYLSVRWTFLQYVVDISIQYIVVYQLLFTTNSSIFLSVAFHQGAPATAGNLPRAGQVHCGNSGEFLL